jgi:competence protein ComGC
MNFFKKGQTATEYLIILAVVIVIALVVVVAMGKFPGMGQSAANKGSQAFWSTQDIAFTSYAVSPTSINVIIRNNVRNTIEITAFTIGGNSLGTATLAPGGSTNLTFTGTNLCTSQNAYSLPVSITYTDISTGASYTFTGGGNQLEGVCAN